MPRTSALVALLAVACSDYELNSNPDGGDPSDTGDSPDPDDSGFIPDDLCDGDVEAPAESVEINEECEVTLQTGTFTPVIEWKYGSSAFCGPAAASPAIDTNGDGALDDSDQTVLFLYQSSRVVAIYGDGSGVAWQTTASGYGQDGGMAVGDLDGDGWPEVVTASSNQVCALSGQDGGQLWCATGLSGSLDPMGYSYPAIADMDGDGRPEVVAGNAILEGQTGSLVARGTGGKGAAPYGGTGMSFYGALSVPIDLDNDGQLELVTGKTVYDSDGDVVWDSSTPDGLVAVADFDNDGEGEIVKTTGIYVYGLETDGTTAFGPVTYSGNLGAPAADDLDGDGTPEFVFAAQNKLIAMEWGGTVLWQATIGDSSGAAGPVLFDFEMDGYPEVLYADETRIRFFSGLDGSIKYESGQHQSYTILETPIVADVDGDDQVEIVLGHCNGNASIGALTVYGDADGSWPPGRRVWNQHAYSITNVGDLGEIPSPTASNWPEYNSFRSGDIGLPPSEYIDLRAEILAVCEDECDTNKVIVHARPVNYGNVEAPAGIPVSLRAGAGGPILESQATTAAIPAGSTGEVLVFEVAADELAGSEPVVTADETAKGKGKQWECDENNNAANWGEPVCES